MTLPNNGLERNSPHASDERDRRDVENRDDSLACSLTRNDARQIDGKPPEKNQKNDFFPVFKPVFKAVAPPLEGLLLVDKPGGRTSFSIVAAVRKKTFQKKIGHAGTLDPIATGLLVLLLGKSWTTKAGLFLGHDKEYEAVFFLGKATDTYDAEGTVTHVSSNVPSEEEVLKVLSFFQGRYEQIPPMFSAKKINGTRLYELARKGISIERKSNEVIIETRLLSYVYPNVTLRIKGSKGTYVRSIAQDFGERLGCGAHVSALRRIRSGSFRIEDAVPLEMLLALPSEEIGKRLVRSL